MSYWPACVALCALLTLPAGAEDAGAEDAGAETDRKVESATFSMYCYWTGEATLGRVDGVLSSRIGHWGGKEIVQVDYDPQVTGVAELTEALKLQRSFYSVIVGAEVEREQAARQLEPREIAVHRGEPHFIEPKHSLRTRHPELLKLDLSESQAIALNSWSYFGGEMPDVLAPEQKRTLKDR